MFTLQYTNWFDLTAYGQISLGSEYLKCFILFLKNFLGFRIKTNTKINHYKMMQIQLFSYNIDVQMYNGCNKNGRIVDSLYFIPT